MKKIERVLVQGEDVTASLDLGESVDWARAIRTYRAGDSDMDTLEVRHARLEGWNEAGTHARFEVFAGWRTPPGNGESERWVGRNYWTDVHYYAADTEERRRYALQYRDASGFEWVQACEGFDRRGDVLAARDEALADEQDGLPKGRHRAVDMETGTVIEWQHEDHQAD